MDLSCSKFAHIFPKIRTVSSSGSTVHVVGAAVPVNFWAASSWAFSSWALLLSSHLDKLFLHGNKRAISSSGSTVHVIRAAVPVNFWAASSWTFSSWALLLSSHLDKPH